MLIFFGMFAFAVMICRRFKSDEFQDKDAFRLCYEI